VLSGGRFLTDCGSDVCHFAVDQADTSSIAALTVLQPTFNANRNAMITTTTHAIEGRQITAYLDIVSAESVQGINVIRDVFAGMRDFFGGRSQTLERALKEARIQATDEIKERARALQADAVVGLDYEISMPAGKGGMVVVFVTGTAVKLR
jgi:uncharacterized protein YbjQ (UPF0145 family)